MRRIILLSTVLFATPFGIESYAADCATTSCQTLGYTATSNKGDCLQCPFGNYWFCPECPSTYKSCDCGGAVGAASCTINGKTTYSSCKSCCDNSCPSGYSLTKPSGCYATSQNDCGNTCYKSQACCDNSCENDINKTCTSGTKTAQGTDGCGNTCYKCCVSVYLHTRYHNGCSCSENADGSCTQYRSYTYVYADGSSSSGTDTSRYSSCSACESAYNYYYCDGYVETSGTECN